MRQRDKVQWLRPELGALESGPAIKIVKVRPGTPVVGFFVSDYVHCVVTHWIGGRTKPCVGTRNNCEGCGSGMEKRPKGYIGVVLDASGNVGILEITEKAFDENLRLSSVEGLRGTYFVASRKGDKPNSKLSIELFDNKRYPGQLPNDIDVEEVLCRVWFGKEKNRPTKEVDNG